MGTAAHITVIAADMQTAQRCLDAAIKQIDIIENLFSRFKPDSEISAVNQRAADSPVQVSPQVYQLIKKSIQFSKLTGGAFDITVGPLIDLWHNAGDANTMPTDEQLRHARSLVGCDKLILDDANSTIRFAVSGMRLDLGGIAKGYGIDTAIETIKSAGGIGGIVVIGGDLRCFGIPPHNNKRWLIGLQNPNLNSPDQTILTLKLDDTAVTTSGDYRRFVTINGRRFSHIINPTTGCSAQGLASDTIITPLAADADALSTAVHVLGPEKGLSLIENLPHTSAILISPAPAYKLSKTAGIDLLLN
jgi:thiamine biosynthesis lipoprotein